LTGTVPSDDHRLRQVSQRQTCRSLIRRAAGALLLLTALSASPAAAKFDPSYEWTTLETPHFLIHFHQDGEAVSRRAAAIAEDVHRRLAPRIRWEPKEKTRLVLVDAADEANGWATPLPYNVIYLYLTHPAGTQGFGLTSYDDWLRLVITHEYSHILQLDMTHGFPDGLQYVLGRVYFPNFFQPVWLIEGLATYEETELTTGGRGRSAWADMVLRTAAIENRFPTLAQAAVFPDSWPGGQVPYLFGESFIRFLAGRYGREGVAEISTVYSERMLPFLVESTALRTMGREYDGLWNEWKASVRDRAERSAASVRARGATTTTPLTAQGFVTTGPSFAPSGGQVAFAAVYGDEYPGIYLAGPDGSGSRKVVENVFPSSASGTGFAWDRDGSGLYFTRIEIVRNTAAYNDIYRYDLATGRERRITKDLRARDPDVSPDGSWLALVMNRMGRTRVGLVNLAGRTSPAGEADVVPVTAWSEDQYETPRWSPDGKRIALGLWRKGGWRDIRIIDTAGNVLEEVTNDRAVDSGPAWDPGGAVLYFSSDRTGIFNLYAYDTAGRTLRQVTNVLSGAFAPSVSPDGKTLAFTFYSSRGYDIHAMAVDPAAWRLAEPDLRTAATVTYDERQVDASTRPYSPLSTSYPRFWFPTFASSPASGTMYGAFTFNEDAVQRHRYLASVYYGPKNDRVWYALDYFYEGFYPSLQFHIADGDTVHGSFLTDAAGSTDYVERTRMIGGKVIIPFLTNARQQWLVLEYQRKRISALTGLPPWTGYAGPVPAQGVLAALRASFLYNDSREYVYSFGPEDGRKVELGAERFDRSLGSDFQYTRYTADWHEYLDLPGKHQVLLARAFGGTSTGEGPPQGIYELGGDPLGDITTTLDDLVISLRGYPLNVVRGSKVALGTLEYRFPILNLERGADTGPFFSRRLYGAVFAEAGNAWDGEYRSSALLRSVGAELRLNILFSYYLPMTLRLVGARGLDEEGEKQFYFSFWVPVELF